MKNAGFLNIPVVFEKVLPLLGYEAEKSFASLTDRNLVELHAEIETFVNNINTIDGHEDLKISLRKEVTRFWQKMGSFKLPSGYKSYLKSIRDHCASKNTTEPPGKKKPTLSLLEIQTKFLNIAKNYLMMIPQNLRETTKTIEVIRTSRDSRSWTISCPLCQSTIAAVYDGKCRTSNFKRHLYSHSPESADVPNLTDERSDESLSQMSVSVATTSTTKSSAASPVKIKRKSSKRQVKDDLSDSSSSGKFIRALAQKAPASKAPAKKLDDFPSTSAKLPVRKELPKRNAVSMEFHY